MPGNEQNDELFKYYDKTLKRGDAFQRWQTVVELETWKDERGIRLLLIGLTDNHPKVRACSALALARKNDERSIEPLIACLEDVDVEVRWCAIHALCRVGDKRALEALELISNHDTAQNVGHMRLADAARFAIKLIQQRQNH